MLLLSYFRSHYKKYDFSEAAELLGLTLHYLNEMIDKLVQNNMLLIYNQCLVLSKNAEEYLEKMKVPTVGVRTEDVNQCKKKKIEINEIYIPKKFEL